jgi:hypothetical protein
MLISPALLVPMCAVPEIWKGPLLSAAMTEMSESAVSP